MFFSCEALALSLVVLNLKMPSVTADGELKQEVAADDKLKQGVREGKIFSIFSVINFPNDECIDPNGDSGTCLTSSECTSRGGSVSGTCAAGFGSCCLIFVDTCGGTVTNNCTYIRNPGYASTYSDAGTCTWTFAKSASNICQIRLDFDEASLAPPSTVSPAGDCSATDRFQGTPVTGKATPLICGENAGQHIYLDAGANSATDATLSAVLVGTATARKWKIKVSQIECGSTQLPPAGCLQYQTGTAGQVRSFNFVANTYQHLSNQFYETCIRQESGYCSIGWTQSTDPESFKVGRPQTDFGSLNTYFPSNEGFSDYVVIPNGSDGGAGQCVSPSISSGPTAGTGALSVPSVDYYGGGALNCVRATTSQSEVISSQVPFKLGVSFNNGEPATMLSRGFCLNYRQIAC